MGEFPRKTTRQKGRVENVYGVPLPLTLLPLLYCYRIITDINTVQYRSSTLTFTLPLPIHLPHDNRTSTETITAPVTVHVPFPI